MSQSSLGPPSASLPGRVQQLSTPSPPPAGRSPLNSRELASCDADWSSGAGKKVSPAGLQGSENEGKRQGVWVAGAFGSAARVAGGGSTAAGTGPVRGERNEARYKTPRVSIASESGFSGSHPSPNHRHGNVPGDPHPHRQKLRYS